MTPADITARLTHLAHIWDTADNQPRPTWDPSQEWAETWAELRAEDRAWTRAQQLAREEDARW